ncbi:hypothetical protein KI688_005341 [Linnemannia hyalina]|uniref:Peptidase S9 prolyl oligopeptidase catalytic domain-containing protein n=1 Tax=Linnemannia hyalina TaxID=64524 RepID=A0A9P8BP28_9FUNG|nr:hypothetical protein KI688_005341 [Linnemannia hyalina]
MKTLTCWLMLAAVAIPLHSITLTVTASTIVHNQQQPLMTNVHMEETKAHQTVMGAEEDDSYLDDATYAKYAGRYVHIDTTWQVLGPFPTGMREQDFGADPLEAFGGFRQLEYDAKAKFPSELAPDGVVGWHTTKMDHHGWVNVHYPDIEWEFNQLFLGWGFNQFQAWARTTIIVPNIKLGEGDTSSDGLVSITIQLENVGDFYVDDERLSGDWYGYGLTRHTLRLQPGSKHTLSVRVVHEVRIFGGVILPPPSKFKCEVRLPFPYGHEGSRGSYQPMAQVVKEGTGGIIVMDAVDGVLAGEYISVALRNVGGQSVVVKSVKLLRGSRVFEAQLANQDKDGIRIFPSTHRPIAIRLRRLSGSRAAGDEYRGEEFTLRFEVETLLPDQPGEGPIGYLTTEALPIAQRKWGEPYIYTFRDFDGTVHYAAAIPPSNPESQPSSSAPVLVALHGAGVETAQSPFWLTEYTQRERTWIVLPTGRSPWGYDWHGASIKNVMNAIDSLAAHLPGVPEHLKGLPGIKPDPNRLFMAGHSNGGQGAWYLATHFPDKAIAATPAAGYVNIKHYVPFSGWLSNSYTDAHLRGILESSIIEFDNDVHMSNTVGIPILARTGSVDDNVPPFHSRKMVRLGQENAHNTSAIRLSEVPGQGHWFTGVLQDAVMTIFLQTHLHDTIVTLADENPTREEVKTVVRPSFPDTCVITVVNPAGMGSKCGIQVEQLRIPYRKGTMKLEIVKRDHGGELPTWIIATINIRRFAFSDLYLELQQQQPRERIGKLVIDGTSFDMTERVMSGSGSFVREERRSSKKGQLWKIAGNDGWKQHERHRETYGPAIQVLEKRVVIVLGTHFDGAHFVRTADRVAKLVAHDIYQYGRGDVEVLTDNEFLDKYGEVTSGMKEEGERVNLVLIGAGHQNSATRLVLGGSEVTIDTEEGTVSIHPTNQDFHQPGTGLLMIRPSGPSNLAMVIAGLDPQGLETAARLFPKRTGMLVPDWIITGPEMAWKGAGGILAAG